MWADTVLTEVGSRPRTDRVINSFLGDDINELVLEKQGALFNIVKNNNLKGGFLDKSLKKHNNS